MRLLRALLTSLVCYGFALFFLTISVHASEPTPFRTDLALEYIVAEDGSTKVEHQYTITNQTPTTFINKYALKTSFRNLQDVTVTESDRTLQPNVAETETGTSIGITFPEDVVGEGKKRSFTISYTTDDIAVIGGQALEVHIPQVSDIESYSSVNLQVTTPAKYGEPVYSGTASVQSTATNQVVTSTLTNHNGDSFSLLYGDTQYYFLSLRYHLENPTGSSGITQVALPPDTSFQRLHYHSIEPLPDRLERDTDGNWIATYTLPPNSDSTLHLSAVAKITLEPDQTVPIPQPTRKHQAGLEFWETSDRTIADLAKTIQTPQAIYDHVVKTLKYSVDYQSIPQRKGAVAALQQPDGAVCQEFTDAFIALSRANDIPARRLTGYAYTQNAELRPLSYAGDILHAWPEYYDTQRQLWVPVDPTWGHTTRGVDYFSRFDLNHIVFAINGVSSTIPYPAGAYKTEALQSKDIEVSFATEFPVQQADLGVSMEQARLLGIPIPGQYLVVLHNQSGQAWYDMAVAVELSGQHNTSITYPVPYLLPFQIRRIPVTLQSTEWLGFAGNQTGRITIHSAKNTETYYDREFTQLTTSPKILTPFTSITGAVAMGIFAVTVALGAGSVLVLRRRRKRAVRR